MRLKEYISALFHGWVGKMSGLASIILTFLPIFFPKAFSSSEITAKAVWIAAAICFLIASYAAWNAERAEKEKAIAKLAEAKNASAPVRNRNAEWKELEERFRQHVNSGVRAHHFHHCLNRRDYWDLQGAGPLSTDQIKSLSEMAGKLLMASSHIDLTDEIKAATSNEWRWLFFVKANYSHLGEFMQAAEVTEDNKEHIIIEWHTRDIAQLSAQACLKCAAWEL